MDDQAPDTTPGTTTPGTPPTDSENSAYLRDLLDDPEHFKLTAQVTRRHYEALCEVGFTPDQAVKIVSHNMMMLPCSC
jgi:hypothetical protein